ncbi:sensor histidine kinase [Dactylosporangium matsuzakiense]|uniref:histidine kinase n=1 Tax=Dactylosporangium matsuzakiense TaxID=53360 RepID=A0A9W6KA39_9ACTN|nr:histidine kinase [Dactylosporangium matsuzakiense]UWZ47232.1 sensor histidine kinase [Dactylosporangium matsuzakiense]GLK98320.1 two-component sensor histidine kinase [Dactylosporangium matsuzakiense]
MGARRIGVWDVVIGVAVAAILVSSGLAEHRDAGAPGYVLLAAGGLVLVARRWQPVAVLVATGLCALGYQAAGFDVFAVAYLVAVYAAVRAGHRAATAAVSVAMLVGLPLAALAGGSADAAAAMARARGVLELAWLIAAAAAGEALRQAERRADEAERTREEAARRRADEERLHIARELHDTLTHQISVIKVQAEAAVHLAQKRGEPVPAALLAIRDAGREAARELRTTLEALRDDEMVAPLGFDRIPDLVDRARSTGLDADLIVEGEPAPTPDVVERTAYRIVQEALTNITRHAAATSASVRIDHRPGAVVVRVDDDGTAHPDHPPVPGVGLLGMGERVSALGGRLRAEPRPGGGFTVQAELPVDAGP